MVEACFCDTNSRQALRRFTIRGLQVGIFRMSGSGVYILATGDNTVYIEGNVRVKSRYPDTDLGGYPSKAERQTRYRDMQQSLVFDPATPLPDIVKFCHSSHIQPAHSTTPPAEYC